jgi:phosphatidylserine/phosphatidylglycerophosphate/cardiolipin synthase-like enzyme
MANEDINIELKRANELEKNWIEDSIGRIPLLVRSRARTMKSISSFLFPSFVGLFLCGVLLASDVFFSPNGGIRDQIIRRINTSKSTIDVAVYSFTSGEIAQALADAYKRGVKIRVVRDMSQSMNKNDENLFLEQNGISVQIRSGQGRGIMHDKFAVFDGKEAFTGSYNWTGNAEQNNWENALFTDEPKVVQSYESEFEVLWKSPPAKTRSPHKKTGRQSPALF